tara:strand:+ start:789 stop:1406 length:618 start_codon:yes stop_codon:yes gene_type:complete
MNTFKKFSVAMTGGIGSGKSTASDCFNKLGVSIIDTDLISHNLTSTNGEAIPLIIKEFGDTFIKFDGSLDRKLMRDLIFSDNKSKSKLETILHPLILTKTQQNALSAKGSYLIFVIPLLYSSSSWKNKVDKVLVIDCQEKIQIQRVKKRNKLSLEQIKSIISSQPSRLDRLKMADDIIFNEESVKSLEIQIKRLHLNYLKLSKIN